MISINFDQFYNELKAVIKNPRPWMHIRYGDGEGIVLGYPESTSEAKAMQRWCKWIGPEGMKHFNQSRMKEFSIKLRAAAEDADILGIPCLRHMKVNQDWRNVLKFLIKYKAVGENQKCCCMDCTVDLHRKGLYKELFAGLEKIYYISCRDMRDTLSTAFGIKNVTGYHLPPQHIPCRGPILTKKLHYPEIYDELMDVLSADLTGKIFLVGAGGLGKIYCHQIKVNGGVALDIGSLFDGWAGINTRSYLANTKDFQL